MEYGANHPCTYMYLSISLRYEHLKLTEAMIIISNVNKYHITPAADYISDSKQITIADLEVYLNPEDPPLCASVANHIR